MTTPHSRTEKVEVEIVKVQVAIDGDGAGSEMLVYNEDQSIMFQAPMSADIVSIMGDAKKKYFHALLKNSELIIGDEAPEQDW